ncbi:hypothetical protein [Bartonella sp. HY038]|uniref:hypothetical protein n=1 Tax=Bartonella sp. HY038 TaxID=2759660 RepID=UPI0015FCA870|nr:hypothetical protein [Bartonella sp. HY038]
MYIKKNGKYSFAFFLDYDDVFDVYNGFAKMDNFEIVGLINIKNKQQTKNICFFYEEGEGDFRCENQDNQLAIIYSDIEAENYLGFIDNIKQHEDGLFLALSSTLLFIRENNIRVVCILKLFYYEKMLFKCLERIKSHARFCIAKYFTYLIS